MEITIKITEQDKIDIAEKVVERLMQMQGHTKEPDRELTTTEAKQLLGYSTHGFFRKYITRNRITPCKTIARVKYYREADLLRQGNK